MKDTEIKRIIKESYARIVKEDGTCCNRDLSCCRKTESKRHINKNLGYSDEELNVVPEGANLGLGCGNPVAIASLKEGETVLDLGSGAGFDCFLAAQRVGRGGKVIGVDMTPEMVARARENASKGGYTNVEFKLGEIEDLPIKDNSVDVIISNCVINLSPDKRKVFAETCRVLRPGGRLMVSDIVLLKALPHSILNSMGAYVGCIAGAIMKDEYLETIKSAGFQNVTILEEAPFSTECLTIDFTTQATAGDLAISPELIREVASSILSIKVYGVKPN